MKWSKIPIFRLTGISNNGRNIRNPYTISLRILSIFEHWTNPILIRLSGKTVITFNTNDGYGIGNSYETIRELCTNSNMKEGFSIQGGRNKEGKARLSEIENLRDAEAKVKKWLRDIKSLETPP